MGIKKALHKISNSITKAILVIVVFFGVITLFTAIANKDKIKIDPEETTRKQRADIYTLINDPAYQKDDAGKAAVGVYRAMMCGAIGEACTDNPDDADENFNHSLFGFVSNLIVMPYANPPASGVQYIAYSLGNAGLIPKTYAAEGIGFASIKPMIEIWKAFRNVAYLILVLVLIAIGFMIMFRMKLNPQTVISLENSLPRIIVALIFITFSFAIAGFFIDLMYFAIGLVTSSLVNVHIGSTSVSDLPSIQNKFIGAGLTDAWPYGFDFGRLIGAGNAFFGILPHGLREITKGLFAIPAYVILSKLGATTKIKTALEGLTKVDFVKNIAAISLIVIELLLLGLAGNLIGAGLILGIIFVLTLLFLMFRIFFLVLTAYIKTLLLILFAPFILLFGVIPGRNTWSFWIKSIVGELLTFPLVVLIMLIGYLIVQATNTAGAGFFKAPFLHGIDQESFAMIIAFGLVLVIPQFVKMTKELIGIKGLPDLKPGFFGGAAVTIGGLMGLLGTFSSINMGLTGLSGLTGVDRGKGLKGIGSAVGKLFGPKGEKAVEEVADQT